MSDMRADLDVKLARLQGSLGRLGRVLVAYSGGVDSAYLAWAAHQALEENMLAIIADSPSLARPASLPKRAPMLRGHSHKCGAAREPR